jgi:hypothetical protein
MMKHFRTEEQLNVNQSTEIKDFIMGLKGIGTDVDNQPKKVIPNNINQVLARIIQTRSRVLL